MRSLQLTLAKKVPAFQPAPAPTVPDDCIIPYDFLRQFLTPDFVDSVTVKSKLYCLRKGGSSEKQSTMTSDNIVASIAIMYLTGYLSPAQKDMFWNDRLDTQNLIAKKQIPGCPQVHLLFGGGGLGSRRFILESALPL